MPLWFELVVIALGVLVLFMLVLIWSNLQDLNVRLDGVYTQTERAATLLEWIK